MENNKKPCPEEITKAGTLAGETLTDNRSVAAKAEAEGAHSGEATTPAGADSAATVGIAASGVPETAPAPQGETPLPQEKPAEPEKREDGARENGAAPQENRENTTPPAARADNASDDAAFSGGELAEVVPTVPVRGRVLFPGVAAALEIGRAQSVAAVRRALKEGGKVFFVAQKNDDVEEPLAADLYDVGVLAPVEGALVKAAGGSLRITVKPVSRAKMHAFASENDAYVAEITHFPRAPYDPQNVKDVATFRAAKDALKEYIASVPGPQQTGLNKLLNEKDPELFAGALTTQLPLERDERQQILEEESVTSALRAVVTLLLRQGEILAAEKRITDDVRKTIDKNQKEYFLREQIRSIHKELGDDEEENEKLKEAIKAKKMPEFMREKLSKELARMDKMAPGSPEGTVIRNYVDLVLDLPYYEGTEDNYDITRAEAILNEDHFGLEKVKERVVEYLAVHALTKTLKGPILCFVGPPGVGKTSIVRSIARAMNRKFVRMSLGGLKDEAEIRGHRRTYIGAMPGRIIYEIRAAKVNNPVFLLDEIDKISSDLRGDPASALLEVLDPEQNATFRDRYLEEEFDLSNVMFVTTANTLETIPAPLRDRMEIIEISGYTAEEKLQIAKRYLLPKKLKEHGLEPAALSVSDGAIKKMIENYTMEAGVRNLERTVADLCRKTAVKAVKNPALGTQKITEKNLVSYLGKPRYDSEDTMEEDAVGLCNGLAWTAVGGVTLEVEVNLMEGKGELKLTGSLGDVMKESALAALTFIRSNAKEFGIDPGIFQKTDVHLHVPAGATPKDGPSAGITIATALYSAFTGRKVKKSVAMTGEITLRGRVLPIGGLKEKALAAIRKGIRTIIAPKDNQKDMDDIPAYLRKETEFLFVSSATEVFAAATLPGEKEPLSKKEGAPC